ncbi:MAG: DNA-binding protein [Myxococcota bacterium]
MKLAIELSAEQASLLREGADRLGIEPEQLALAAVMDLITSEAPDFEAAATRVLEKNRELYRRLA